MTTIPIANLYYLLLYAWDRLDVGVKREINSEDHHSLVDLLARVLMEQTRELLRRGVDRGYLTREEIIPGIRGRLMLSATVKQDLIRVARAQCAFDELSADVLHNQILKATLGILSRNNELNSALRKEAGHLHRRLAEVTDVRLDPSFFARLHLHRNNAVYDLLMQICRFLSESLLVDETTGRSRFADFERDVHKMRNMFERFALNFFRRHFPALDVASPTIDWFGIDRNDIASVTLPMMETDIVVRSHTAALIIDTKFTPEAFSKRFDKERARTGHLYQLFTYVKNYASKHPSVSVTGMLLYPVVNEPFAATYRLHEHMLQIRSIDLRNPWRTIERDMRLLIDDNRLTEQRPEIEHQQRVASPV